MKRIGLLKVFRANRATKAIGQQGYKGSRATKASLVSPFALLAFYPCRPYSLVCLVCLLIALNVLYALFAFVAFSFAEEQLTPDEILQKADEVRNPQLDYTTIVKVTSFKTNKEPMIATYEVMIKGREKSIIKTLSPPIDKGRILLMLGSDLWAYLPDVSKPLRISFQERLMGDVANGDIARVNFSGDYTPAISRMEKIDQREYYVLDLGAKADYVTYAKAALWVEKETLHPFKAEFYGLSGRLLKTCSYEGYKELAGTSRPGRLVMYDPIVKGKHSVIEYDSMEITQLPDKYFTKDYMKKFME